MASGYEILGRKDVGSGDISSLRKYDVLGAGLTEPSFLIDTASELAKAGAATYQEHQKSEQSKRDEATNLNKAIAADASWASALANLELAQTSKDSQKIAAAQALANSADAAAMSAGAGLSSDSISKRQSTAQDNADKAAKESLANPKDAAKTAKMNAWQKVAARAGVSGGAAAGGGGGGAEVEKHKSGGGGTNFLTKMYGPMPLWGWGVTGVVGLTGVVLLIRMLRRR